MKTPQEIRDEFDRILVRVHARDEHAASTVFHDAITAAREEGRREGIEQAATFCHDWAFDGGTNSAMNGTALYLAERIRALASHPKPAPAVTCEGCKRGLPLSKTTGLHWGGAHKGEWTPCTAKPEGGKEPGT